MPLVVLVVRLHAARLVERIGLGGVPDRFRFIVSEGADRSRLLEHVGLIGLDVTGRWGGVALFERGLFLIALLSHPSLLAFER